MTAIGFDPVSGQIVISDNGVYGARTLTATMLPDGHVRVVSIAGRGEFFVPWSGITDLQGNGFTDTGDVLVYLQGEFAKRPASVVITPYPITAVSSFTVNHGLAYAPRTTIIDPAGAEMDTDIVHAPGQTTLIFAEPFTGTLYLG